MIHFLSMMFSLLAIIGHVSGRPAEGRSERSTDRPYKSEMTVSNGMNWGMWGPKEMCPNGTYAAGFSLRVDRLKASGDNTALNGIRLHCVNRCANQCGGPYVTAIYSKTGSFGEWTDAKWCHFGYLKYFYLRVESFQGSGDDTAANNIRFYCSDGYTLQGDGTDRGNWGDSSWNQNCAGKGICGLQNRIQEYKSNQDNTGLNDVHMFCCD